MTKESFPQKFESLLQQAKPNIILPNPEKFRSVLEKIEEGKSENLHILSDFDKTLTRAYYFGEKFQSIIAQLRDGGYLTPDYPQRAYALYDKYAHLENAPNLSPTQREGKMMQWWREHNNLLIECGFSRQTIEELTKESSLRFRDFAFEIFDLLNEKQIPLIIMSAAPGDILEEYLRATGRFYKNTSLIANHFEFDENGTATAVKEPIIHSLNKHEIVLKNFPEYDIIRNRRNVILLGDSLGDTGMVEGFDFENLLCIGFYNEKNDDLLPLYKEAYDLLITADGSMEFVYMTLKEILQ